MLAPGGGFWTPNGRHRLEAMRRLGAKSITALVIPEREVAWQILALNTEKAHNLKERSLEVIRIYRGLVDEDGLRPESGFAFYLDQAALVTLGVCYERVSRFGGGAYHPILRRLEDFSDDSLRSALKQHEKRAMMVFELEEKVAAVVKKLKERGLVSPYLRSFVVARINPLRWIKGEPPALEDVLKTVCERGFKVSPVIAVLVAGLVIGNYGRKRGMSATTQIAVDSFWEYAAFVVNSLVFLLIGLEIRLPQLATAASAVAWGILAMLIGRIVAVYGLLPLTKRLGSPVPLRWQHVLFWGGLRGSLSIAMALSLPASVPGRSNFIFMIFGVVLFSLLVQGLTVDPLLRWLRFLGQETGPS